MRIRILVVATVLALSLQSDPLSARTLDLARLSLELPDGWMPGVGAGGGNDVSVTTLQRSGGIGTLKLGSYDAGEVVTAEQMRNLTNLEPSIALHWQHWGDFSGYQYEYVEQGVLHRQWWLANERTVVLVTYARPDRADPGSDDLEEAEVRDVDAIVRSLTAVPR